MVRPQLSFAVYVYVDHVMFSMWHIRNAQRHQKQHKLNKNPDRLVQSRFWYPSLTRVREKTKVSTALSTTVSPRFGTIPPLLEKDSRPEPEGQRTKQDTPTEGSSRFDTSHLNGELASIEESLGLPSCTHSFETHKTIYGNVFLNVSRRRGAQNPPPKKRIMINNCRHPNK